MGPGCAVDGQFRNNRNAWVVGPTEVTSSFTCKCGAINRNGAEPSGSSFVAFPLEVLRAAEAQIARHVADFAALPDDSGRAAWLKAYFGSQYPGDLLRRDIIEDIVSRELNGTSFLAIFRCPSCGPIATQEAGIDPWLFYRPEVAGE